MRGYSETGRLKFILKGTASIIIDLILSVKLRVHYMPTLRCLSEFPTEIFPERRHNYVLPTSVTCVWWIKQCIASNRPIPVHHTQAINVINLHVLVFTLAIVILSCVNTGCLLCFHDVIKRCSACYFSFNIVNWTSVTLGFIFAYFADNVNHENAPK